MRNALIVILLLLGGACASPAVLTVPTDLEPMRGKVALVYIGDDLQILEMCAGWGLPGSVACVSAAEDPDQRRRMLQLYIQRSSEYGIDCVILAPASAAAVLHELTLCGKRPAWYWNKADPKA